MAQLFGVGVPAISKHQPAAQLPEKRYWTTKK